ncbi:MAG: GAF domain-containing protein [Deltaproteobacteria bacterium]|nr:GAF domain-containing protein [Deltaproteobacteria bacterium]
MGAIEAGIPEGRGIGRRKEDFLLRERLQKHVLLFNVGQILTSEMHLIPLFEVVMDQTNQMVGTQRSTVFLYDENSDELWSLVATGMRQNEIRIPSGHGVAGWVFQNRSPLLINDAYRDQRFYSEVDKKSGFRTRNILCVPLFNQKTDCIGALQALNKERGDFTDDDVELLKSMSHYVAIALENSKLYEQVKGYSERLKQTLLDIETLEKVKSQLTKFVPSSVARMVEQDPDRVNLEKVPTEVTILFIDIQGFSAITEGFDQRLVNDMVECHFSEYLECVKRHGGEVNEVAGDGLMVIFKEGEVESHAREAVAAAMEIIAENHRMNQEVSYPWGGVDLHLGINSGRAYVGSTKMKSLAGERWTYTASGMVTVLAARIGALSGGTRLYIGPDTHAYVRGDFECEFLGERELKNVKGPVPVYWVKDVRA